MNPSPPSKLPSKEQLDMAIRELPQDEYLLTNPIDPIYSLIDLLKSSNLQLAETQSDLLNLCSTPTFAESTSKFISKSKQIVLPEATIESFDEFFQSDLKLESGMAMVILLKYINHIYNSVPIREFLYDMKGNFDSVFPDLDNILKKDDGTELYSKLALIKMVINIGDLISMQLLSQRIANEWVMRCLPMVTTAIQLGDKNVNQLWDELLIDDATFGSEYVVLKGDDYFRPGCDMMYLVFVGKNPMFKYSFVVMNYDQLRYYVHMKFKALINSSFTFSWWIVPSPIDIMFQYSKQFVRLCNSTPHLHYERNNIMTDFSNASGFVIKDKVTPELLESCTKAGFIPV